MTTPETIATSRQLALALFNDADAEGLPIETAKTDIGFARKNVLVRIVDLGVSARRLIDAAYYIVAQEEKVHDLYDVELDYFKWLMRYSSRNSDHLEQVITEAQKALVQATSLPSDDGQKPFGSVQLIGRVSFQSGRFQFRIPPDLVGLIRGPGKSHWLSLRITSLFTQSFARVLYDNLLPYADDGITDWIPLADVRAWQGEMGASNQVFKYFKRDLLEPSIDQIAQVSNITVSYETRNEAGSRKIGYLRFRIERKTAAEVVLNGHDEARELYDALKREFGLSTAQFNQIAEKRAEFTDERIKEAIERTRLSLKLGKVTKSPAGFFMKALKEGWVVSEAEREMLQIQQSFELTERRDADVKALAEQRHALQNAAQQVHADQRRNDELRVGWETYLSSEAEQQDEWRVLFKRSPASKLVFRKAGVNPMAELDAETLMKNAMVRDAFAGFVFIQAKSAKNKSA